MTYIGLGEVGDSSIRNSRLYFQVFAEYRVYQFRRRFRNRIKDLEYFCGVCGVQKPP